MRKEGSTDADCICGSMAVVRMMPIKSTWKELVDIILESVTP